MRAKNGIWLMLSLVAFRKEERVGEICILVPECIRCDGNKTSQEGIVMGAASLVIYLGI